MHLSNCLNPHKIRNRVTGEYQFVPCGKCEMCLGARSALWVERINAEMSNTPFTIFATLTYDTCHVPKLYPTDIDGVFYDDVSDVYVDYSSYLNDWSEKEVSFMRNSPYIMYLRYTDFQKFIKRLRRYIDCQFPNLSYEQKQVRYFACGEYGETLLRPHWHMLLFIQSQEVAKKIGVLLSKAWSLDDKVLGNVKAEFVNSSAPSYVAKYLNSVSNIPRVLQVSTIKPKALFSKRPFIGFRFLKTSQIQEIFYKASPKFNSVRRQQDGSNKSVPVPLWRSFENYLFPRFSGFSKIDDTLRVEVYGLYSYFQSLYPSQEISFLTFNNLLYYKVRRAISSNFSSDLENFLFTLMGVDKDFFPSEPFIVPAFRSIYFASRRVYHRSTQFCISESSYVSKIIEYYSNKSYYRLVTWFEFLEDYFSRPDCKDSSSCLLGSDPSLWSNIRSLPYSVAKLKYGPFIESFGIDFSDYYYDVDNTFVHLIEDTFEFRSAASLSKHISLESRKTKRKNDYLSRQKYCFDDVEYYSNIDNYFK